jgi:hypothetical protein
VFSAISTVIMFNAIKISKNTVKIKAISRLPRVPEKQTVAGKNR